MTFQTWIRDSVLIHTTPVFGRVARLVLASAVYALAVTLLDRWVADDWVEARSSFHALLGAVLGMLLVFRTNTAYDRWWEGRKLWGQLTNDSRNLAIKVQACVRSPAAEKDAFGRQLVSFAFALRDHLRGGARLAGLDGFAPGLDEPPHVPLFVATKIYSQIESWRQADQIGGYELLFLDRHAAALMDVCGACERIRSSPISASWRRFVRQSIGLYLFTLPWGLVEEFGLGTILAVPLVAYFMIGIELIAEGVEDPFGTTADDLKLDEICRGIRRSVSEVLGPVE